MCCQSYNSDSYIAISIQYPKLGPLIYCVIFEFWEVCRQWFGLLLVMISLTINVVRYDMDVNKHEILSNIRLRHKLNNARESQCCSFVRFLCSILQSMVGLFVLVCLLVIGLAVTFRFTLWYFELVLYYIGITRSTLITQDKQSLLH